MNFFDTNESEEQMYRFMIYLENKKVGVFNITRIRQLQSNMDTLCKPWHPPGDIHPNVYMLQQILHSIC